MSSSFERSARFVTNFAFALLVSGFCGCAAHLATVKTEPARLPTGLRVEEPLESATKYLIAAEHEQPSAALGHDLLAAKISYGVLERQPKNESARSVYNFSVARVLQDVDRTDLEPWQHPVTVATNEGRYTLVSPKPVDADHDPSRYDLFTTDTLKIGGKFFKTYSTISGLGAPIAVVGRTESPQFRRQYKLRRVYAPITAIVRFSGRKASLEFIDPLNAERITLNKKTFPLAADFDAPTALLIARERPERLGFSRVMNPEKYADTTRLCQLQQYDPNRTPVILVHGLQETASLKEPSLQRRIHHRGVTGCWRIVLHQLRHVRLDLVAAYGELFSESEHVGREPLSKDPPRLKSLGPLERLGVVEIVVHHVQSMQHDRDCYVIDREGHADLHALVCSLNVGRTRQVDNRNE